MNIVIKGIDVVITPAIKSYAEKKVGEALSKFYTNTNSADIFISIEISKASNRRTKGDLYKVSAKMNSANKNIFLEALKDDLYVAIDALKDKLVSNISGIRSKRESLSRKVATKFKNLFLRGK